MGHYDSYYEADYAEQRAAKRARAEKLIPEIAKLLEAARIKVAQNKNDIEHSTRIEDDLEFLKSALYGQLGRAA